MLWRRPRAACPGAAPRRHLRRPGVSSCSLKPRALHSSSGHLARSSSFWQVPQPLRFSEGRRPRTSSRKPHGGPGGLSRVGSRREERSTRKTSNWVCTSTRPETRPRLQRQRHRWIQKPRRVRADPLFGKAGSIQRRRPVP